MVDDHLVNRRLDDAVRARSGRSSVMAKDRTVAALSLQYYARTGPARRGQRAWARCSSAAKEECRKLRATGSFTTNIPAGRKSG